MSRPSGPSQAPDKTAPDAPAAGGGRSLSGVAGMAVLRLLHSRWVLVPIAVVGLLGTGALIWTATREAPVLPGDRLRAALLLLDDRENLEAREQARRVALELQNEGYRDPEFPGGVDFILGQVAFRDAEALGSTSDGGPYGPVVERLRQAEVQALDDAHRPEWAFALGMSLQQLGSAGEAQPLLEEAVRTFPAGRLEAAMRLIDIYLDLKTAADAERALQLSDTLVVQSNLEPDVRDRIWMQRAQILMAMSRTTDAEQALSQALASAQGTIVLKAQALMSRGAHREALALLQPVSEGLGLDSTWARQARYMSGLCAEALGDAESAIELYERTAQAWHGSHEAAAALLRAATLLRKAERSEEAIDAYRQVLGLAGDPDEFRNRWLSLQELREGVLEAWNDWVREGRFDEAALLGGMLTPLLPEPQGQELAARASQMWAERLEQELAGVKYPERLVRERQLRQVWRESGQAWAAYASAASATAAYPGALWTSADHFRRGHDFAQANEQLAAFIETRPQNLLPLALLRRGQALLDLDRRDEALEHFQKVVGEHATDPAAIEARFELGRCHLERGELADAERIWREVITDEQLTPDAVEWRRSLFSLGRLLSHTAAVLDTQAERARAAAVKPLPEGGNARWVESSQRLQEFLDRYPSAPEAAEARFLLGQALQRQADHQRALFQAAETDNARDERRRAMRALLQRARTELQLLQAELRPLAEEGRLDPPGQSLVLDCEYEIGHAEYALENHEGAIAAYGVAINRAPQDPRAVFARLQIADCYQRLGKPVDARSTLEQARLILQQMPGDKLDSSHTNFTRSEWERWLDWAGEDARQ